MASWKPGFAYAREGYVRLEAGQRWFYCPPEEAIPSLGEIQKGEVKDTPLFLVVVSTSPNGEVVLRPEDSIQKAVAEKAYALREAEFKGQTVTVRRCPFSYVEERVAKGSKGQYQEGDLLCHEAWDIWQQMRPLFGDPPPADGMNDGG